MLKEHVHETPENTVNQPKSSCCRTPIDHEKISKFGLVLFTFSRSFEFKKGMVCYPVWCHVTLPHVTRDRHTNRIPPLEITIFGGRLKRSILHVILLHDGYHHVK